MPDELTDALVQSSFLVTGVLSEVAARHDLSLTQLRLLGIVRDRRLRMAELADYLGLEKSSLSGLVDRAERRGLLERVRNADDARVVEVQMTRAGRMAARRVETEVRRALVPATHRLGAADRRELTGLLERLVGGPA